MSDDGELVATAISDTDANAAIEALTKEIHAAAYSICEALYAIQAAIVAQE